MAAALGEERWGGVGGALGGYTFNFNTSMTLEMS